MEGKMRRVPEVVGEVGGAGKQMELSLSLQLIGTTTPPSACTGPIPTPKLDPSTMHV